MDTKVDTVENQERGDTVDTGSPGYSLLAPRPWTSFKETPPSPLLVLRRKARAPPAPLPPVSPPLMSPALVNGTVTNGSGPPRKSSKKRAPAPPARSSSLKSSEDTDEENVGDQKTYVKQIAASPKIALSLDDTVDGENVKTCESFKSAVSIFVFPEVHNKIESSAATEHAANEDAADAVSTMEVADTETASVDATHAATEDSLDAHSELVLDATTLKVDNSLDEVIEDFGDTVNKMKKNDDNTEIDMKKDTGIEEETVPKEKVGTRLTIKGWETFVEGRLETVSLMLLVDELLAQIMFTDLDKITTLLP